MEEWKKNDAKEEFALKAFEECLILCDRQKMVLKSIRVIQWISQTLTLIQVLTCNFFLWYPDTILQTGNENPLTH